MVQSASPYRNFQQIRRTLQHASKIPQTSLSIPIQTYPNDPIRNIIINNIYLFNNNKYYI